MKSCSYTATSSRRGELPTWLHRGVASETTRRRTYSDVENELRTAYAGTRLTGRSRPDMNAGSLIVRRGVENTLRLKDFLLNAAVLIGILGVSAFITGWFTRTMYIRCAACGTLNAQTADRVPLV